MAAFFIANGVILSYKTPQFVYHKMSVFIIKREDLLQNAAIIRRQSIKIITDKSIMHLTNEG